MPLQQPRPETMGRVSIAAMLMASSRSTGRVTTSAYIPDGIILASDEGDSSYASFVAVRQRNLRLAQSFLGGGAVRYVGIRTRGADDRPSVIYCEARVDSSPSSSRAVLAAIPLVQFAAFMPFADNIADVEQLYDVRLNRSYDGDALYHIQVESGVSFFSDARGIRFSQADTNDIDSCWAVGFRKGSTWSRPPPQPIAAWRRDLRGMTTGGYADAARNGPSYELDSAIAAASAKLTYVVPSRSGYWATALGLSAAGLAYVRNRPR